MAAPAFRAAGLGPPDTTTSTTIPKPAGTAVDDVLYAVVSNGMATSPPTGVPSGWALTQGLAVGGGWAGVYEHVAGAAEPADYTWSGFVDSCAGCMVAISGADTTTPTHQSSATANPDDNTATGAGVTTTAAECLIVGAIGIIDNTTVSTWTATDPATLTERAEVASTGGDDSAAALATAPQTSVGATGDLTVSLAGSRLSVVFVVAVQPPQGGGGSVQGTLDASLPALTASAAGTVTSPTNDATVTATLPALTAGGTATVENAGAAVVQLPALTATATGTVRDGATMAAALPALTATASATTTNPGTATASLPALAASAAVDVQDAAVVAVQLPALTARFGTGTPPVTGALTATLPALAAAAATTTNNNAALAAALPALTAATEAAIDNPAAVTVALPALTAALTATQDGPPTGTLDATLPALTAALASTSTIGGALTATLPALTVQFAEAGEPLPDLAGTLDHTGTLTGAVHPRTLTSTIHAQPLTGTLAVTGRLTGTLRR